MIKNKRKVLFLIESLAGGGAENVLVTLLNNIDKSKFDITLCTIVDVGVNKKRLSEGIQYKTIIKPGENIFGRIWYAIKYKLVYKLLPLRFVYLFFVPKGNEVEVAFVEGFTTKLLSYSTNIKARKYAWVHIDLINNHWIEKVYKSIEKESDSYKRFNCVVGVSNTVKESLEKLYRLKNVITIYNPIDSNKICDASRSGYNCSPTKRLRMVTTGRLVHQKGYDRLLKIVKRLIEESVDVELLILGEGSERAKLQNYIDQNKLSDRVYMPGFVENPYSMMAECSLFVCSSRSEGYSTAVTEALILGLPVVTTNCSGMVELLEDGKYGIITENKEEPLYKALKIILTSKDKLNYYKKKAEERGDQFNLQKLLSPIEQLLIQ